MNDVMAKLLYSEGLSLSKGFRLTGPALTRLLVKSFANAGREDAEPGADEWQPGVMSSEAAAQDPHFQINH